MQRGIRVRRRRVSHAAVVVLWLRAQGEAVAFMGGFGHSEEHGQAQSLEGVCKSVNEFWVNKLLQTDGYWGAGSC